MTNDPHRPGSRRLPIGGEARLADDLAPLPEKPPPDPPRRRGVGLLLGIALLCGLGLGALDLYGFVAARFQSSAIEGWIAAGLSAALLLALVLLAAREFLGLKRLARVEAVGGDVDRAADAMQHDPRLARAVAAWRGVAREANDPDRRAELFERHVLAPLDAEADAAIRAASLRMAGGVLVLPSALLDTVWFAAQGFALIRRIARIYGLAPGAAATWKLSRRVLVEAGAVGAADAVAGGAARLMGAVPGLADAGIAGVAGLRMARIGVLAKRACRPLAER
jgi:putative membrane protein